MVNTRFSTYIKPALLDTLPIDLKRDVLELAAYMHPPFALRMAVVSREVQQWAERIIYRELFFDGQRLNHHVGDTKEKKTPLQLFKFTLQTRPPKFFAEYVRSLHFDGPCTSRDILPIIQVCTSVTNFGLYATIDGPDADEIARLVHSLPLHTLFISNKNLTCLLALDVAPPSGTETSQTASETPENDTPANAVFQASTGADSVEQVDIRDIALPPLPSSCLHKLRRLALVDGFKYPAHRFPALTHLALIPDFEDQVISHIRAALMNWRIESLVVMQNYINAPRQVMTIRAIRDITDPRLVLFTLPVSKTRYIEDDLWDLANEFPEEEQPITYLEEIPGPKILTFQELMDLGL